MKPHSPFVFISLPFLSARCGLNITLSRGRTIKSILSLLLFLLSPAIQANSNIAIASNSSIPVSVTLDVPADYVGLSVSIRSDSKEPEKRLDEVARTRERLVEAVAKKQNLELRWVKSSYSAGEGGSFKFSSSYGSSSQSELFVLGKLDTGSSVVAVVKEIISVVSTVKAEGDVTISAGTSVLGVLEPEQYRSRLLELLAQQIKQLRTHFGQLDAVEISGIEAPVAVIRKNDSDAVLYIPYRLKLIQR